MDSKLYKTNADKIFDPTLSLLLLDTRRVIGSVHVLMLDFCGGVVHTIGATHLEPELKELQKNILFLVGTYLQVKNWVH